MIWSQRKIGIVEELRSQTEGHLFFLTSCVQLKTGKNVLWYFEMLHECLISLAQFLLISHQISEWILQFEMKQFEFYWFGMYFILLKKYFKWLNWIFLHSDNLSEPFKHCFYLLTEHKSFPSFWWISPNTYHNICCFYYISKLHSLGKFDFLKKHWNSIYLWNCQLIFVLNQLTLFKICINLSWLSDFVLTKEIFYANT